MRRRVLLLAALLGTACGGDPGPGSGSGAPPRRLSPVAVSGPSPLAPGCEGAAQTGQPYRNSEVEPWLAADPATAGHLLATWQQDRWSSGGASALVSASSRDGGRTWTVASAPFTRCTGGTPANGGDYERASDPWATFAPDGTAYQSSLSFDDSGGQAVKAVLVSRSVDGGRTWSDPVTLARDDDADAFLDKETITADPLDARYVYAVWDRLANVTAEVRSTLRGPTWFSRTTDGGASWEVARVIHDPGADAQTVANQIVVLPDGALVNSFVLIRQASQATSPMFLAMMRSTDHGATWSAPVQVDQLLATGTFDPATHHPVRTGTVVPAVAADPGSGRLYLAWQDGRFGGGRDAIVLSTSDDGGVTWSAARAVTAVSGDVARQAFRPALAVAPGGTVALTYYDFRGTPGTVGLGTSAWLATSADGGQTWEEEVALATPFDLRLAPDSDGYFLGDYTGLAVDGGGFVALFAATAPGDPAGLFAARWPSLPP